MESQRLWFQTMDLSTVVRSLRSLLMNMGLCTLQAIQDIRKQMEKLSLLWPHRKDSGKEEKVPAHHSTSDGNMLDPILAKDQ
ncbi:hypothetical protein DNTS_009024 [Danionella cerebrum]|uniref:Uncharacterized protein n=1 Tax=Danionella cerebrum TaxID=2873325 RepID=A0A553QAF6_9TELE|nr:hypothetical protein DNTS_009024 [Danionella translucida]